MKLLNSFWFVDVGRLLYNGPTISHFFINSRIKRWIDWKKWKRLMGGPLKKENAMKEMEQKPINKSTSISLIWFLMALPLRNGLNEVVGRSAAQSGRSKDKWIQWIYLDLWSVVGGWPASLTAAAKKAKTFAFSHCLRKDNNSITNQSINDWWDWMLKKWKTLIWWNEMKSN